MILPIIVLGSGGHANVLIDTLIAGGAMLLGIVDIDLEKAGTSIAGIPVIGDEEHLLKYAPKDIRLVNGIGSVRSSNVRREVYQRHKGKGYTFATVMHPGAVIAQRVTFGEGVQIMAGVVVQPDTSIDENTIVNTSVSIDHDCHIGAHVHVAPGVTLSGSVRVGNSSHIGSGAVVIHGIRIGERVTVAAGAVVVRDVMDDATVGGVPAIPLRGER